MYRAACLESSHIDVTSVKDGALLMVQKKTKVMWLEEEKKCFCHTIPSSLSTLLTWKNKKICTGAEFKLQVSPCAMTTSSVVKQKKVSLKIVAHPFMDPSLSCRVCSCLKWDLSHEFPDDSLDCLFPFQYSSHMKFCAPLFADLGTQPLMTAAAG